MTGPSARQPSPPAALVRRWLAGWAAARDLPDAEAVGDGVLRTRVGAPGRDVEYVVLDADASPRRVDRAALASLDDRDPWISVPTSDPGRVADRLAEHGLATAALPEWLMERALDAPSAAALLPSGYAVRTDHPAPHCVEVRVTDPDGATAASGRLGVAGGVGVPDRVSTAPGHRRRGLGSVVMGALGGAAVDLGCSRAVLVASQDGRRLYLTLGWDVVGAVVVARRR